jgi:AcrR family transcriptional regulator
VVLPSPGIHNTCQPARWRGRASKRRLIGSGGGTTIALLPIDPDSTQTSRSRLLAAGKTLFARHGYEQTSTAAIAREAGTSESQLVRYFDGKAGLLEAIFNESWRPLNEEVQKRIANSPHARDAVLGVLSAVTKAFGQDPELAFLFLFEGRRVRGATQEIVLSKGFLQFAELVRALIRRGQQDGSFPPDFRDAAVASAVMGAAEGMIRDRLIAQRFGRPSPFSEREIRHIFAAMLQGLSQPQPAREERPPPTQSV